MNIDITIPEEEIISVLKAHVASKMPALNVTDIDLKVTRNPQGVIAAVTADFGTPFVTTITTEQVITDETATVTTEVTENQSKEPEAEETETVEETESDPEYQKELEEVEKSTKKLFGKVKQAEE